MFNLLLYNLKIIQIMRAMSITTIRKTIRITKENKKLRKTLKNQCQLLNLTNKCWKTLGEKRKCNSIKNKLATSLREEEN